MRSPVPPLTKEARIAALAVAKERRRVRATILGQLRSIASVNPLEAIDLAVNRPNTRRRCRWTSVEHDVLDNTLVIDVLCVLPGVGRIRATKMMDDLKIAPNRRMQGLGPKQRRGLLGMWWL